MSGLAGYSGTGNRDMLDEMSATLGGGEASTLAPAGGPAFAIVMPPGEPPHIGTAASTLVSVAIAADTAITVALPVPAGAPQSLVDRVAAAYAAEPHAFVARLDGRFALALHDAAHDRLVLACDRSGAKTIFWTLVAGSFRFATSLKALLATPGIQRRLDELALDEFLAQGFTGGTRSLFAGIHRLPAGHQLVHERGATTVSPTVTASDAPTPSSHTEELGALLAESVAARLATDKGAGCFLNGSLDSSLVLALMHQSGAGRVQTFAIDWAGSDGDREAARRVARTFDTEHHELEMGAPTGLDLIELTWLLDLPVSTPSVFANYALSSLAREHVGRVFSGQGASQLFGRRPGCTAPRAPLAGLRALLARLPGCRHLRAVGATEASAEPPLFDVHARHALYSADVRRRIARRIAERTSDGHDVEVPLEPGPLRGTKPLKLGRATRAQRVDLELPYLDPRVIDWATRLAPASGPRALLARDALREVARRLLPDWIVDGDGHKRSLPISAWLRGSLSTFAGALLGDVYLAEQNLFDPEAVAKLCASLRTGGATAAAQLWRLMAFQLWYLIFLEEEPRARALLSHARHSDALPVRTGAPLS